MRQRYAFGPFLLDSSTAQLWRDGAEVQVQRKAADLLIALVERAGEVLTPAEVKARVWPDVVVSESAVAQAVRRLRIALGDTEHPFRYVEPVLRRGYRFRAEVEIRADGPSPRRASPAPSLPAEAGGSSSLPVERDAFVGREADLRELERRFRSGAVLVSLLGIGGTGKTRLAIRYAWASRPEWPGGAWFCDLSEVGSAEGIVATVAAALRVPADAGDPVRRIGHALAYRGRCLVVLDNFEQLTEHAAETLGRWLDLAPEARFLVTTRVSLGVRGEEALAVPPLTSEDAEDLFTRRVAAVRPGFSPDDDERQTVRELVRRLDHLPLAIELAAARAKVMSPRQIVERLTDRFRLLTSSGGRPDRQATLRATLDWSWGLLDGAEQAALAQLATFEGGFTLEAAEAVLDLADVPGAPWTADVVQALVDHSLVRVISDERFDLLVSVREYAAGRLAERGAVEATHVRHGAFYARLGDAAELERLRHAEATEIAASAVEGENLEVAVRRALDRGDASIAGPAWCALRRIREHASLREQRVLGDRVVTLPGLEGELATRVHLRLAALRATVGGDALGAARRALELAEGAASPRLETDAWLTLGSVLQGLGRPAEAIEALEQARQRALIRGDLAALERALSSLGNVALDQQRLDDAAHLYEQARGACARAGRAPGAYLDLNLGAVHRRAGRLELASEHYEAARHRAIATGDRKSEGVACSFLAIVRRAQRRPGESRELYERALALFRAAGDRRSEGVALANFGGMVAEFGQASEAIRTLTLAVEVNRDVGNRRFEASALAALADVTRRRSPAEAYVQLERAATLAREVGDGNCLTFTLCVWITAALDEGKRPVAQWDELQTLLRRRPELSTPAARQDLAELAARMDRTA